MDIKDKIVNLLQQEDSHAAIREIIQSTLIENDDDAQLCLDILSICWIYEDIVDKPIVSGVVDALDDSDLLISNMDKIVSLLHNLFYSRNSQEEWEQYIKDLVIADSGTKRMVGRKLWDETIMAQGHFNILHEPEENQVRFAISLLQDFMEIENRLDAVLPLLNSNSQLVREVLVNTLFFYAANYPGLVADKIKVIKPKASKELSQLNKFIETLNSHLEQLRLCPELQSEYAYPKLLEHCINEMKEHMEVISEESKKNRPSLLNMLTTVILGRAGGTRKEDGTTQVLSHIEVSYPMPLFISSFTPKEQLEYTKDLLKDWSTLSQ